MGGLGGLATNPERVPPKRHPRGTPRLVLSHRVRLRRTAVRLLGGPRRTKTGRRGRRRNLERGNALHRLCPQLPPAVPQPRRVGDRRSQLLPGGHLTPVRLLSEGTARTSDVDLAGGQRFGNCSRLCGRWLHRREVRVAQRLFLRSGARNSLRAACLWATRTAPRKRRETRSRAREDSRRQHWQVPRSDADSHSPRDDLLPDPSFLRTCLQRLLAAPRPDPAVQPLSEQGRPAGRRLPCSGGRDWDLCWRLDPRPACPLASPADSFGRALPPPAP